METTEQKDLIQIHPAIRSLLYSGTVIPAHPLALDLAGSLDEQGLRRLTQYYISSGAGGVAVGVHTTQFEIRDPGIQLLEPVLKLVADEIRAVDPKRPFIKIAGICGDLRQSINEAVMALKYGYHLGLLSMGGLPGYTEHDLLERARTIASIIPVFGFYLQPAVGGRVLDYDFWRAFAEIPGVYAIKIAAFNRYQTLDVVRAVCESSRRDQIVLYTGNDDNIVADLLTPFRFSVEGKLVEKRFAGGLLGHWAFCTGQAVELLAKIKHYRGNKEAEVDELLALGVEVTDTNAAVFDVANNFHGCIAGIHEMLRRQNVMTNIQCLRPEEKLSPGQLEQIERVCRLYHPALAGR